MRKTFLCLFVALMAMTATLKAQTIVFTDGFESGNLSKWTQENVVGNGLWAVESIDDNLQYPGNVLQGTHRAYLRNTTGETQGYVTRLISPAMQLDTVYQPMVVFWYANPKWTGDRDTLRLLYRVGEKAKWKQLAEYSDAKAEWTKVAISLPEYDSENYQIAFEGKDNLGRGIVLDSVCVRSAPQCTDPKDLIVTSEGAGKATISWTASWDADEFDFIITTMEIDPDTIANIPDSIADEVIKYNIKVSGLQHSQHVELTSGEYFYAYIRSNCEAEKSNWNPTFRFRMRDTKYLPFSYDFNMDYNGGKISRNPEWTWGTNAGVYTPHINTNLNDASRLLYSKDGTTCLCFCGLYTVSATESKPNQLAAGKYAYVAAPAVADSTVSDFNLKDYQVHFWATLAGYTGRRYANSIIVGVMTDAEDYTTFVPVDTVSVWGTKTFQENIVSLENYQGDGVYVVFASDFEKANYFFVDDVTIERRTSLATVTEVYVNPRNTFADITWKGNATSYNVMVTSEEINPNKPAADKIVAQATVNTNSYKCVGLEQDHSWKTPYYVYVQAKDGDKVSDWSYRYPFVTIADPKEVPYSYDFEAKLGNYYTIGDDAATMYPTSIGIFSNDPEYPHLYSTNSYKGTYCLYLTKDPGNDSWITLPMVDNLQNKQLMFFLSGSSTPDQAHATVGVMTNPMDINTFIPVAEFTAGGTSYTRCYMNFAEYQGPDGIIAIVWKDVPGLAKNTINYIDELTVDTIATCLPPVNIQIEATTDSATFTWNKSEATKWEYVFASAEITEAQRDKSLIEVAKLKQVIVADTFEISDANVKPELGIGNLKQTTNYFFYIRTICGDDVTWWSAASFKTPCPELFPFPYKEDFEEYAASVYEINCWQMINYGGTGYPKTLKLTSGAQSGTQLELWSTGTTHRCAVIMPPVEGNLSDMALFLDTRSWSTTAKSVLYIGSMADINDSTTFVPIDTIYNEDGNKFTKVRIDLSKYKLAHNNIAFTSGLGETLEMNSDVMIDNVELRPNNCIEAFDFIATDISTNSIDIEWNGKSGEDKWEIKVLNKYAALKDNVIAPYNPSKDAVVDDTIVSGKAFHVEGLEKLTKYYFYIRTLCGDSIWMVDSLKSGCTKLNPNVPNKETFEEYPSGTSYNKTYQADCWTVGNGNPSAATTYIPFIYKTSSTYASSGTNAYRLYPTAANSPAWVASPEIDCKSLTELAVTFSYYGSSSYYILPGVMTDPTDLSTFVVLDSIKCAGKIVTLTMDLSEYKDTIPATAKYFAWRTGYNLGPTIYLDDVSIIHMACPMIKPSLSELKSDSVLIRSGLGADSDFDWALLVTDSLISLDSLAVPGFVVPDTNIVYYDTISDPYEIVTGLEEKTQYYAYMVTVCEEGVQMWKTLEFMTPCKPVTPEALGTITFDTKDGYVTGSGATRYLPCWTIGSKKEGLAATSTNIPYVYTSTSYLHNGYNCLYVYTTQTNDGAYAIMPQLDVDEIKKYQVSFWGRGSTTASYNKQIIVGVVTDPSDLNTFVAVDTVDFDPSGTYQAYTISFEDYKVDYQGNKGKYIMFLAEFGKTNYAYLSEISVSPIPTCRDVAEFSVDSIAEDMARISWKQYSDSYRVLLADKALKEEEKPTYKWLLDSVVAKTDSVEIRGLKAATQYYVYAQALCEGGDSSAISMAYADFVTECPVIAGYPVPYYNDFDKSPKTGSGNKPLCWDGVYMVMDTVSTSQTYPYVYTTASYAASTPYSMYMYSYGYWNNTDKKYTSNTKTYAVAPKVEGNLADYMVSLYARKGGTTVAYGNLLRVGYVTDATLRGIDTTFVKIADINVTTATQQAYQVIIGDYVSSIPAGARLALLADWGIQTYATPTANTSYYGTMYIDNFKIGLPPSCFPPTLEPGNTALYTADVTIIPAKAENNKWQLAVVPDSVYSYNAYDAAKYLAGSDVRIVDADSANFVLSGLTQGTKYWLYGRTVCGGEDGNSAWTDLAVSTRTKYYYEDSFYFGFEKTEDWERSQLSTSDTYIMHPAIQTGFVQLGSAITSYSYLPHGLVSTSTTYHYGYGDQTHPSHAVGMRWNATASYYGQYAIFPAIQAPKDRSFEFKLRNGYMNQNSSSKKWFISTTADIRIEIGTIDKNAGMETYQKIAVLDMPALPDDVELTAANDWLWRSYTLDLDSATLANKQIVFFHAEKPKASCYPYIDLVTMGESKGYGLVAINNIVKKPTSATIEWANTGGPWNLYILNADADTIARYENLTNVTSQEVTGLTEKSFYTAVLVAANAPKNTKYYVKDSQVFRTPCLPLEANANGEFYWNFDDPNETEPNDILAGAATDTAYLKPTCFTTGTNYTGSYSNGYQWLWQSKGHDYYSTLGNPSDTYNHREIGYDDSFGSLRVFTSSTYISATVKTWIALPELNCDLDTMMVEFWARAGFANQDATASSNPGKVISTTYIGASYSKSLVIGTMDDPKDFSTVQVIDTVTYVVPSGLSTSTNVGDDPTNNRYWQKMQVPLSGAKGKYIVFFQPAYGLFFVDDLTIKSIGDNLFAPASPAVKDVTTTTATVTWMPKHTKLSTVLVLFDKDNVELDRDTLLGSVTEYTFDGLTPATAYAWSVYQTDGNRQTLVTAGPTFYTECVDITPDYTNGFEELNGWRILPAQTSDTYKQTMCWTYGNAGTSAVGTNIYNYKNSATIGYAHKGEYALRLYAYSTTAQTYAAMPAIEDVAAYDTLQINFWMRPGYHGLGTSTNAGKISTQYTYGSTASTAEYYYAKSVIVGTMTDPNDPTTFVPIDTVEYAGTFATGDVVNENNDFLFQKKKVILTGATGKYVTFMSTLNMKGQANKSTYDYVWLDDVWFSPIQYCDAPENMNATEIGTTTAKLSWEEKSVGAKYVLQVSSTMGFADEEELVFNDTVTTNSQVLDNLKANSTYAWRVQSICGEDLGESEFSHVATFNTARAPFYLEDFRDATLDPDWTFATNPSIEVLDSTNVEFTGSNSTTYGWKRITNSYGLSGAHYVCPFYSSSTESSTTYDYYWMISPTVVLSEGKNVHLSANVALTQCTSGYTPTANAVAPANVADDFVFMVAISDDGGKTWKKENAMAIAGQQLLAIPNTAYPVRIDLTKFAGKAIKIGLYREAKTYKTPSAGIHVGNIRINYFDELKVDTTLCQYEDVEAFDFFVDGDKVEAGDHIYTRTDWAGESYAKAGMPDTIYTLAAHYNEVPVTMYEDTICEGDTYTDVNFHGKTVSGLYSHKMQGANCDSIVKLNLAVLPKQYTSIEDTICEGQSIMFHGQKCDRTGVYEATITSSYGCDSTITLALTVVDAFKSEFNAAICAGTPYYWEAAGKSYTEPGDYTEKLVTATGCDSIVTLHLKNNEVYSKTINVTICEGASYEFGGKVLTQAGQYVHTFESVLGCDSTVTLNLSISDMYRDTIEAEIMEGEAYKFYDVEYDTEGTYDIMRPGKDGDCDSLRVLVLTVKPEEAIDNVTSSELVLVPTILNAGETVRADYHFTKADLANLKVDVYDIVGRQVEAKKYEHQPIIIDAFPVAGVYTVRITTGTGLNLVGRVVVR